MKIGITGATGFIGRYLLPALAGAHELTAATARADTAALYQHPNLRYVHTSYDWEGYLAAFSGCDAVVHLGARRSDGTREQSISSYFENLASTEALFQACRDLGISNVVNISSVAVYDPELPQPFSETQAPRPLSYYGVAKLAAEEISQLYNRRYGMKIKSLRLAQVLGLGERDGYMPAVFLEQCRQGQPLSVYGQGVGGKEYIYVKDVVRAIALALEAPDRDGVYNIGSGVLTTNRALAEAYCAVFQNPAGYRLCPDQPERVEQFCTDVSLARQELGFSAAYSLEEALADMRRELGQTEE